ncbi:MAG: histidine phosphatase family protein [Clostridia bacterium]|nr:histidine phosphatase family protein [Clostridia bacterium]
MTKVILVRHCQAEGNLKRFFQGRIDTDITETGRKQIGEVMELLSAEPIDEIYCTSLTRARKTAEGINLYHELPIHTDDSFLEIDAGDWEGKLLTDIAVEFPEQYENWCSNQKDFSAPNGESMAQVYERVKNGLLNIVKQNPNKIVCIVSHGCAIKNMMCFAHGWTLENMDKVPLGTNTSVNIIEFDDNLQPKIILENYTDHLQ